MRKKILALALSITIVFSSTIPATAESEIDLPQESLEDFLDVECVEESDETDSLSDSSFQEESDFEETSFNEELVMDFEELCSEDDSEENILIDDFDQGIMVESEQVLEGDVFFPLEEAEETSVKLSAMAVNVAAGIPEDALYYGGHYYYIYNIDSGWAQAKAYCEALGGYLATITNQEENDVVFQYMKRQGYSSAYFGYTDEEVEGTWKWITGEESDYSNWASGEPNGENSNEDYAMFYYKFTTGKWNDGDFGGSTVGKDRTFICEWGNYTTDYGRFDYINDTWNFSNPSSKIPVTTYQMFFDKATAKQLQAESDGTGGHCAGMAMSVMSIFLNYPRISSFGNYASLNDIGKNVRSSETNCKAIDYIDYAFTYQFTQKFLLEKNRTRNDYAGLYNAVYNFQHNNGAPVYVSIGTDQGGHALMGLEIAKETSNNTQILVYDCNHPNEKCYLTLNGSKGAFSGWSYPLSSSLTWDSSQRDARTNYVMMASDFIGDYKSKYAEEKNASMLMKIQKWANGLFKYGDNIVNISGLYGYTSDNIVSITPDTGGDVSNYYNYWLNGSKKVVFDDLSPNAEVSLAQGDLVISTLSDSVADISVNMEDSTVTVDGGVDNEFMVSYENSSDYLNSTVSCIEGISNSVVNINQTGNNTLEITGTDTFTITYETKTENADGNTTIEKKQKITLENADNNALYQVVEDVSGNEINIRINEDSDGDGKFEKTVASTEKKSITKSTTVTLSKTSYIYNGKVRKPAITVKDATGKIVDASNYTVTYSKGRKNVGTYTVKVIGKGYYNGTVTKSFKIVPKGTSISKLSSGSKGFTVKWKKQSSQVTGYQIQYSTNSKFSSKKTITVSKKTSTFKKISKLKGKKKYYVRIRTYKSVNGKKYYSSWSSKKSITTKK